MTRIVSRSDALARGFSDAELQRYCRTKAWRRLRPGKFVSRSEFDTLSATEKHRVIAEAVYSSATADDTVVSHVSAAVFHGLDVEASDLRRVHLTRNRIGGSRKSKLRIVHAAAYSPSEVTLVDGVRVTTLARTIADIGRSLTFENAVCLADLAARRKKLTRDQVLAVLDACPTHPDNRKARRVANFMDGRAESGGESLCRIVLHELGYAPRLQVGLADADGEFARVDFYLDDIFTVVEFDGRIKYGRLVPEGQTPSDVAWKEKRREDRIRSGGAQVVRLTYDDLQHPERIARSIRAAADRARKSPPPTLTIGR
ncbi:hypothetical protein HQ346_10850 [Rhodococcus sp. BP-252]|uniref:hypothetical protein n=1 Tax=unclassified Rhodococcus (in: high G+C Gram-positive bacteria) TaxID=192944 RepID=UPI001C9B2A88|nr:MULTISPECIES: hypothetical protein [unclassified Rhodococcus (in: high G+C Gram-positive bacteria)]MBY6412214.1 hypothetical protein [Rhodococcus sp. BP-320]MBY6416794.1 hypothetical protein [Rhodococcus sp. BP-321]MBY6421668.1 hypothetical protein [Rhodococcus sp. BP-324]MBY6426934.1 hypothetical protein [Rhodococcus sp. BP-323]MBY6432100.1 hypothetical protein [Rhodococcus sp. BP-322]